MDSGVHSLMRALRCFGRCWYLGGGSVCWRGSVRVFVVWRVMMAKEAKRASLVVSPETAAQLRNEADSVGAPSVAELLRLAASEQGAVGSAYLDGLAREVDQRRRKAAKRRDLTWSRWFGQLEGLVKVYSDCEITPSSSSAPALTGGCHGWHEAGSYPVIDDDDALWNCGNLAAGAQAWAAALAREISNGLWAPASPPSGFSATVSGRPQAGQVHIAGWDMVLGPLMR